MNDTNKNFNENEEIFFIFFFNFILRNKRLIILKFLTFN